MSSEKRMPRHRRGFSHFFTFLFFIAYADLPAQDIHKTFLFAEQQFASANYSEAIATYQRVLFFDDGNYRSNAYHHLGNCLSEYP